MRRLWFILLILGVAIIFGCAPKQRTGVSLEDNPSHHYLMGMELIEQSKIEEADNHFTRALYLDKNYSPALAGKALVHAIYARNQKDQGHWEVEFDKVKKYLNKARKKVENNSERFIYHVTAIRAYFTAHPKGWLKEAEDHYSYALNLKKVDEADLPYYQTIAAAHYFMGYGYYLAYEFRKAEDAFSKVLSSKPGKWHDKADRMFKRVQKIVRAMGQYTLTGVGKKIAVKPAVTRGDVAALLVDELHLDKFMAGRIVVKSNLPKVAFTPADVLNHPFKDEILTVIKWNIRGLEPEYDKTTQAYLFKPEEPITRKQLAFIIEDLLIKLTGDNSIATAYFGTEKSPFPDVPVNVAWFNAVMNCTSRGLMEPDLSGEFRPDDNVEGAELIGALMKLRNIMNIN